MNSERECLIRSLFDQYIEMYASRDDRLTTLFSESFSGYTGSSDQLVTDRDEWIRVTRLDFAQIPGRIHIEMRDIALQELSDNVVAVTAFFHIQIPDPALFLTREITRLSLVFRLEGDDWKITHSGISIPFGVVRDGEVYPIARLHEKNSELLALVDERTKALQAAQDDLVGTLNAIPDLLFDVDVDGFIHGYRASNSQLLVVPPEVFLGKRFQDVLPPDAAATCMSALQQANEQGHSAGMYYELLIGQTRKCFELSIARKGIVAGQGVRFVVLSRDITERKLMSERLAGSEARYANLIQSVDGIVWEADAQTFDFTFISEQAQRLLGFSTEEWLTPGFWVANLHPDDKSWAPEYCASCTGRLEPHNFEYRFITKDGRIVWLKDIVTVVAQAGKPRWLRGLMVDITASKMAEQARIDAETRYRAYFERSMVGMATTSPEKGWIDVNPALCEMLRYSEADLTKKTWAEITYPDDLARDVAQFNRMLSGGITEYELDKRFVRSDGQVVYTHLAVRGVRNPDSSLDYVVAIIQDITDRKSAEVRLRHMAQHDNLTGLVNRSLFADRLESAISSALRDMASLALMAIDLDGFKPVNDRFGHPVGDLVLQEVARRMVACVRDSDTVARNGGDEFFVLLRNVAGEQDVLALAEKIRASLEQPFVAAGHVLHISCCVGVALFPWHGKDELTLTKHADFAMYRAKESGRNQVRLYEEPNA